MRLVVAISTAAAIALVPISAVAETLTTSPAVERRAVEAALWGMPIVSFDAMREAYFRDAGARYNDVVYWSRPSNWANQVTTPNNTSHYVYLNFNTKDGPVVLDLPPSDGLSMYGNLETAWQIPVVDFGPKGVDAGKGGKFVLLPPGDNRAVPAGYTPIPMATFNGYVFLRSTPASDAAPDVAKANAWIRTVRAYPLSQASAPPQQRYIDMFGKLFDGIVRMDDSYYVRLARMLAEESSRPQDMVMTGLLRSLGIERGKPFSLDEAKRRALKRAADKAHAEIVDATIRSRLPWWPESKWTTGKGTLPIARGGFTYEADGALLTDERAQAYHLAFALPAKLGEASFYLTQFEDSRGAALSGESSYKLHVPAGVPAGQFWSVTVYDLDTAGFVRDAPVVGLDSNHSNMRRNADGSVDVHFAPGAPKGGEGNWIYTRPGRKWFATFRFYAPQPALFDRSWKLPDIERN